jgi:hypothetical protein
MKHDPELMKALLLNVRDGGHKDAIDAFPEPLVLDQCAYLIDGGFVDGQYLEGNAGQLVSAVMTRLLPPGHNYLSQLEEKGDHNPITTNKRQPVRIFISHSSLDRELGIAVIDLIRDALPLLPEQIRCTSVDGYRLPSGANTSEQLRTEIHGSETFVALLTAASVASTYVLFELGARWGIGHHWALLTARGLTASDLHEPLKSHNALDLENEAQIDQFLGEIADTLGVSLSSRSAWGAKAKRVAELARAPA